MTWKGLFFLLLIAATLIGCKKEQDTVVIYNTVDHVFSKPVLEDFEKETGIKVKGVYDTEETKSTGILNRLIAEKDNPQCDVFWSGDPMRTEVLRRKGLLASYKPENIEDIPEKFIDPENKWTGFSSRARVLIYNKEAMPADSLVPQSIFDLTKEKFRGKVAIANPLFGTTTFHVAALFSALGDKGGKTFMQELAANDVVLAASNGDVKKRVSKGEVPCGLTDTDDAYTALKSGAAIGVKYLDQDSLGTLIIPNTISLIKGSPNPENGKKLINYLLKKETEAKLAESCAQMPLHSGVETPEHVRSVENIRSMDIDYGKTAKKLEAIQDFIDQWVSEQ